MNDWVNYYIMRFANNPDYVSQLAVSTTGRVYVRVSRNQNWGEWKEL